MARDILIIDDEADIRLLLSGILSDEGYQTREAPDSDSALAKRAKVVSMPLADWPVASRYTRAERSAVVSSVRW